jgi:hypothetical protein
MRVSQELCNPYLADMYAASAEPGNYEWRHRKKKNHKGQQDLILNKTIKKNTDKSDKQKKGGWLHTSANPEVLQDLAERRIQALGYGITIEN